MSWEEFEKRIKAEKENRRQGIINARRRGAEIQAAREKRVLEAALGLTKEKKRMLYERAVSVGQRRCLGGI